MTSACKPQDTQRRMPRLAGKGGQGTGRTAYGIRGYIRSMKRSKRRMQADKGKQGRNTRAMNHTHTLDTAVRKGRGDRVRGGNLQGFRNTRAVGHRRQECKGRQSPGREPPGILIHMHAERSKFRRTERQRVQHRQRRETHGSHTAWREMDGPHETE